MRRAAILLLAAAPALAQTVPLARVAGDAKVIDRVAEASKKDLPRDLLRRIVDEDLDLLRGKRADGTFQYAGYERFESGRVSQAFSVDPGKTDTKLEVKGPFAFRLTIGVPSRRMLVTKNKRVFIQRVEIEYLPVNSSTAKVQSLDVGAWIEPGSTKNIELDDIGRQATARVFAKADDSGYGNVVLTLIEARVFDNPDSPYADAVQSEKAIARGLEHDDVPSIRAMAMRVFNSLQPSIAASAPASPTPASPAPVTASVDVVAPRADADVYAELQAIEDLLTGTDSERRQGLDRLHQLVRRLRK